MMQIRELIKNGIHFPRTRALRHYLYDLTPEKLCVSASSLCQLRCADCSFQKNDHDGLGGGFLKFENFKRLIDENPTIREIEISNWGEVFLNPELVEIMSYAHEKNVLLTAWNGTNFNTVSDEQLQALVKYGFKGLSVSIDGASPDVYAKYRIGGDFDTVMDNVRKLQELKKQAGSKFPLLKWQYVIMEHNESEVGDAKALAKELGINIDFKLTWNEDYRPKDVEYLKKETGLEAFTRADHEKLYGRDYLGDVLCKNLFLKPQINWDGEFIGCANARVCTFGINVFEQGLDAALHSDAYMTAKKCLLTLHPGAEEFGECLCFSCPHRKTRELNGKALEPDF